MSDEEIPRSNVPTFLDKLYTILEKESPDIITWNSTGDSFIIISPTLFSQTVMGKYFKSNKFNSFVRQLNFYGFRKTSREWFAEEHFSSTRSWEFKHPNFLRGHRELFYKIKRKQIGETYADGEARFTQMENEIKYLHTIISDLLKWKKHLCERYPSLQDSNLTDISNHKHESNPASVSNNVQLNQHNKDNIKSAHVLNDNQFVSTKESTQINAENDIHLPTLSPFSESFSNLDNINDDFMHDTEDTVRLPIFDDYISYDLTQAQITPIPKVQSQISFEPTAISNTTKSIYSSDFFPPSVSY